MIPFEIDVARHVNLDERAGPRLAVFGTIVPNVILEQLDVVLADGRGKQLAKVGQRIVKVFRFADLLGIDDPAYPYLIEIGMLFEQGLEIDGVDQRAFAICHALDGDGLLDERQRRTRA